MACVVVFCTVYALILPAITMEQNVFCGYEEHVHTQECYGQITDKVLICSAEHLGLHVHGEDCYDSADELVCGELDYVAHGHDSGCYDAEGNLICPLPVIEGHVHTEQCYTESQETAPIHVHTDDCFERVKGELVCSESEADSHRHEDACYEPGTMLLCTQPEDHIHGESCKEYQLICTMSTEPHRHNDDCFESAVEPNCGIENHDHESSCYAQVLICELDEGAVHEHGTECYAENPTLVCQLQERHQHTDSCYESVLVCNLTEQEGHRHSDECYRWEDQIVCGLEEVQPEPTDAADSVLICELPTPEVHVHDASCFAEQGLGCAEDHEHNEDCEGYYLICERDVHEHELACYSDPDADVESASAWEKTLERVELTGDARKDLLAIAQTQLGYAESEKNYDVWEDQTMHGYTRYGDWYGDQYGDWCAMFVSFCLNYANLDEIPYHRNVTAWIEDLNELEIYRPAGEYSPIPGDLIFFDLNENEDADHIGIVEEIIPETEYEKAQIKVLEGNSSNCVQYVYYRVENPVILGFAELPENLTEFEITQVASVKALIDALPAEADPDALTPELISDIEHANQQYQLLTDEQKEYVHNAEHLLALVDQISERDEPVLQYNCGVQEEHTHGDNCYDEDGILVCQISEHVHTDDCMIQISTDYFCGDDAHEHNVACTVDLSDLSEEDQGKVCRVILEIDEMPSADEIDKRISEFEDVEDYEGEEAWLTEVYQLVGDIYFDYKILQQLQAYVVNADKLLELEYIWSAQNLVDEIASDAPTVVGTSGQNPVVSTSDFVTLNIYDYYGAASAASAGKTNINNLWSSNKKYPGFQWNGGAYMTKNTFKRWSVGNIDFGNSMITDFTYGGTNSGITNGISRNFQSVGNNGGTINQVIGYTNQPIGYSSGSTYDAMKHTLVDRYPALSDGTSLKYLFSESSYASKKNTANIDGLFRQNQTTGEYWYDSRDNHAFYSNNRFTLYDQIITPNFILYPFGNFLPFNSITDRSNVTEVSKIDHVVQGTSSSPGYMQTIINRLLSGTVDAAENQLIDMLARYRDSLKETSENFSWTVEQAINNYFQNSSEFRDDGVNAYGAQIQEILGRLYNIDFDVKKNFFFGMDIEMNFMQPKDGMTGNDTNKDGKSDYPMKFYFAGDDDVWVYIDGILFLDLSGIHRHVGGDIDFVNGKVNYYMMDSYIDGAVETTPYKTYTFAQILRDIGGIPEAELDQYLEKDSSGNYTTFKDYSSHNFKFYYMERGSGSSVCRINFNFPLLKKNSISVSKELDSNVEIHGNPDYRFQVLKANSNGTKTKNLFIAANTQYTIYDSSDKMIGTGTTDSNGVFTLKAGQRAEFTGINENAGKYYVRELLDGTVLDQYGKVTVSGESTTTSNNVTIGSDTFTGMDSPIKDMSDGATAFRFTNQVDANHLGSLSVSKQLQEYPTARDIKYFDIEVTLDGNPIAAGTRYTVGEETRTVQTPGILTIAANEKATIDNVLAGTKFTVKETSDSAEGYIVTYSAEDGYRVEQSNGGVSGVILTEAEVQIIVRNAEQGADVTIPGTKALLKSDGSEHTYAFRLTEVTDKTGETEKDGGIKDYTATATAGEADGTFAFKLSYVQAEQSGLPMVFYYRITEDAPQDSLPNETFYVAEITLDLQDGNLTAAVTNMWKDGKASSGELSADFTNILTGSLTLSKRVSGSNADDEFQFTIELEPGDSGLSQLSNEYSAVLSRKDGTTETVTVVFTDGVANQTLKNGDSLKLTGIPYGVSWTITETDSKDYLASYTVNGSESTEGTVASGIVSSGDTVVGYTNTMLYELPETGGAGIYLYTLGGLLLMMAAAILLYIHNKRRREVA